MVWCCACACACAYACACACGTGEGKKEKEGFFWVARLFIFIFIALSSSLCVDHCVRQLFFLGFSYFYYLLFVLAPHSYYLTYFDFRGRGELSRLLFAAAGVDYVDSRYKVDTTTTPWTRELWLQDKDARAHQFPYGQLVKKT